MLPPSWLSRHVGPGDLHHFRGRQHVSVTPLGGEPVRFGAGDLVVFAAGLSCTWEVHAPVRKHYRFG